MVLLAVRVTPRAARPGIGPWQVDAAGRPFLEVRVAAAPADGAANEALIRMLAKALGLPGSKIAIASGHGSRMKRVEIPLELDEARRRLSP